MSRRPASPNRPTTGRSGRGAGRASGSRGPTGRYTPPIPREVRRSPRWYPFALLTFLIGGVLVILLNYVQLMPDSPTNWYLIGGLIAIVVAAIAATRYH